MDILIEDNMCLFEIQENFSKCFPHLKLEFFDLDPTKKKIYSKANLITNVNKTVGEIRHIHRNGHISINGHQKVNTLEERLLQDFGIHVQVFRKSGSTWLQTTSTDEWTLAEQNQMAETISKVREEKPLADDNDYHEQL